MFGLDHAQCDAVGLTFVLNHLTPDSPYGGQEVKRMKPFGRDGGQAARKCFDNIEKIIRLAEENPAALGAVRAELMVLKNIRGSVAKCAAGSLSQVELFEVKRFLLTFEKLWAAYYALDQRFQLIGTALEPMSAALEILDPEGKRLAAFAVESPALSEVRREKQRIEAMLHKEAAQSAVSVLSAKRYQICKREDQEESRVMRELSEGLRAHLPVFTTNMDMIGLLDLTIAKAMLAVKFGGIRPQISEQAQIKLEKMSNPYIAGALAEKGLAMTEVSLTLPCGVSVITGANMGGKSVSVKTAILNTVLCQMGFFVFARHAEIPLFDAVNLTAEDLQDAGRGLSSFGAEMVRLSDLAGRLKSEFMFVAMDEFARGTNPEEGAAIVRAVASYLSETGSICLLTTHYDKVVLPAFKHYQVAGLKLSGAESVLPRDIARYMDYNLIEAGTDTPPPRDALKICEMIGLDGEVLDKIKGEYAKGCEK